MGRIMYVVLVTVVLTVFVVFVVYSAEATNDVSEVERSFYVSPAGSDAGDGSEGNPWRTIARAIKAAGPGVTINLRGGVYREAVTLEGQGGTEGRPLTLQSADGERAVLDGEFSADTGVAIRVPHVVIRGLEIRNYSQNGIMVLGRQSHHVLIEKNVIHHISSSLKGEGKSGARGIWVLGVSDCRIRQNTIYFVVGNNESFGVLFDVRSAYRNPIHNAVVERNLFYLIDKSGVRIVDNTHDIADDTNNRCYVLADPARIRGNISIHIGYVGLEINYMNTSVTERGPLGDKPGAHIYVEDNFVGWCSSYGINPKQSADGITRHNTIFGTKWFGYLQSGGDSYRMRIEGNLLAGNVVGSMVHTVGEGNQFAGNYYRQPNDWPDFFWDRTKGWGTTYTDMADLRNTSVLNNVEAEGLLDNEAELFHEPEKGDFRLIPGCPAVGTAPDGQDFGARESVLTGVGASGQWGLGNVPMLPEAKGMRVTAFSSEDTEPCPINTGAHYSGRSEAIDVSRVASGLAEHLVDGVLPTCWRPENGQMPAWVIIELPGETPVPLGAFAINVYHGRYRNELKCNPRDLKLYARTSANEQWQEIGSYTRYARGSGRIFPIDGAPMAKQIKLEILSNHGWPGVVEIGEFRLYRASGFVE